MCVCLSTEYSSPDKCRAISCKLKFLSNYYKIFYQNNQILINLMLFIEFSKTHLKIYFQFLYLNWFCVYKFLNCFITVVPFVYATTWYIIIILIFDVNVLVVFISSVGCIYIKQINKLLFQTFHKLWCQEHLNKFYKFCQSIWELYENYLAENI